MRFQRSAWGCAAVLTVVSKMVQSFSSGFAAQPNPRQSRRDGRTLARPRFSFVPGGTLLDWQTSYPVMNDWAIFGLGTDSFAGVALSLFRHFFSGRRAENGEIPLFLEKTCHFLETRSHFFEICDQSGEICDHFSPAWSQVAKKWSRVAPDCDRLRANCAQWLKKCDQLSEICDRFLKICDKVARRWSRNSVRATSFEKSARSFLKAATAFSFDERMGRKWATHFGKFTRVFFLAGRGSKKSLTDNPRVSPGRNFHLERGAIEKRKPGRRAWTHFTTHSKPGTRRV